MPRVKSFSRGGIHVDSFRSLTSHSQVRPLFLPSLAVVPLVQFPGARAEWVVELGDFVAEDQILAKGIGPGGLAVHSPIPGQIVEFKEIVLPGGEVSDAALVRLEGEFRRTGRPVLRKDWALVARDELLDRIRAAGIYLEASPLDPPRSLENRGDHVDARVINALQPEPDLTLSVHLQETRAEDLAEGVRILQKLFVPSETHLAADPDHPETWERRFGGLLDGVRLHPLEFKYPQAQEGILLRTLGVKGARVLILDAASVLAVRDAVVEGKPQVERIVMVTGKGVRNPGAYLVRIGTPLVELLKDAGGLKPGHHKILHGGPFQGRAVGHLSTPVMKSTQAVLVLDKDEVHETAERACIRCGLCVESCPVGLEPINLYKALALGDTAAARDEGLDYCIDCGICSYVCPSRVPLASAFGAAKEEAHAK